MAYFPDIRATMPAQRRTCMDIQFAGHENSSDRQVALERSLSDAVTGWKAALLKPLNPFFRHKDAGALVTVGLRDGAAAEVGQDVHDK